LPRPTDLLWFFPVFPPPVFLLQILPSLPNPPLSKDPLPQPQPNRLTYYRPLINRESGGSLTASPSSSASSRRLRDTFDLFPRLPISLPPDLRSSPPWLSLYSLLRPPFLHPPKDLDALTGAIFSSYSPAITSRHPLVESSKILPATPLSTDRMVENGLSLFPQGINPLFASPFPFAKSGRQCIHGRGLVPPPGIFSTDPFPVTFRPPFLYPPYGRRFPHRSEEASPGWASLPSARRTQDTLDGSFFCQEGGPLSSPIGSIRIGFQGLEFPLTRVSDLFFIPGGSPHPVIFH